MTVIKLIFNIIQNKQYMRRLIETSLIHLQNVDIYVLTRKHFMAAKTLPVIVTHVKSNLVPSKTRSQAIDRSLVLREPAITQHEDITLGFLLLCSKYEYERMIAG